jgi:uracil-DNA glycosylase
MIFCLQFSRLTFEKIKPKLIIALGTVPAAFLSHIWPEALYRRGEYSMNSLDDLPKARVTFVCVAIAHPSMPNAFQRRPPYQGIEGEILLLKEARREAEGKPPSAD